MNNYIRKDERYKMTFNDPDPNTVRIGEVDIILPDMPEESMMKNYYKKTLDQKYQREVMPDDIAGWKEADIYGYAEAQWHRRTHGEWHLIKGKPFYMPGGYLLFNDWWTMESSKRPEFRIEAWELFMYWYMYIERDPKLYGLFDTKVRRLGDTEKLLCISYERTTRYRNVKCGLQSYTDEEAAQNFSRLANAHRNMPFFFRPNHSGSDKEQLMFKKSGDLMTDKRIRDKAGKLDLRDDRNKEFLGSEITFEATRTGKYDGRQLFTWYLDEIFKIMPHQMNVKEQWNNMKRVQSLHGGTEIYGLAMLGSTVEEKNKKGKERGEIGTVEIARYFWENSDPLKRDDNGETYTGLARLFRGSDLLAQVDEWGFHKSEQLRKHKAVRLQKYMEAGDYAQVIDLMRKEADTIEDALTEMDERCPLHPELCHLRWNQINLGLDRYNDPIPDYRPEVVEGELEWENGVPFTKVVFRPKKGGNWHISQHPVIPNNIEMRNGMYINTEGIKQNGWIPMPKNMAYDRAGIDPYDAANTIGKGSDGAIVVKRRWNPTLETEQLEFDRFGKVAPEHVHLMNTNQVVCDYQFRHANPDWFYMDCLKTLWYYGISAIVELDKPGLAKWLSRPHGDFATMGGFMQWEPKGVHPKSRRPRQGVKATAEVIQIYVGLLSSHVQHYIWAEKHPRVIKQWAHFVTALRTRYDLGVASGMAEIGDIENRYAIDGLDATEKKGWSVSPYDVARVVY